jgi:hypothetical protein
MKVSFLVCSVGLVACLAGAQGTNGPLVDPGNVVGPDVRVAPVEGAAAFIAPPVVATPTMTSDVLVVETVVTTNVFTRVTTNRVERLAKVVATNATLRRFVVDIDADQTPTRFTSYMSDGSVVVTAADDVGSLSNRVALSTFNGLLRDVISNGRRSVNTNVLWQARGTNGTARLQRVWSAASPRP